MIYEYRNQDKTIIASINEDGHVVILEPNHPDWEKVVSENKVKAFAPDPEILVESLTKLIDDVVETTAKSKGYNSAATMASYVNSTIPSWAEEAKAFVAWRDLVWSTAYTEFFGKGIIPTPEEALGKIPEIKWPGGVL